METNYIKHLKHDEAKSEPQLKWKDLYSADFNFNQLFYLKLSDGNTLHVENVIRIVPKKRMIVYGIWQHNFVVAKLFFDRREARRHAEEELAGIKLLRTNKVPTPPMIYQGISEDRRFYIILYERIMNSNTLDEIWRNRENTESLMTLLESVMTELATQHVFGIMQHDLHMKNFLITPKTIFTLDGAEIESVPGLLSKKLSMENLSLFLSQLGAGMHHYHDRLFSHYAKARGWILKQNDFRDLLNLIKNHNIARWDQYVKKIYRESTQFVCLNNWTRLSMVDRSAMNEEFTQFLQNPDDIFKRSDAIFLKKGRSSTVIKVTMGKKELVIKRYNIKNIWHYLRRFLRPTRAYHSWKMAHKLYLFGVRTPKPIAFIEKNYFGLRSKSYYVSEYISGIHANDYFSSNDLHSDLTENIITKITLLLKSLQELNLTHGDLKLTNIILDKNYNPTIIDLDGTVEHASKRKLRRTFKKEIKRFLRNFLHQPYVYEKFVKELLAR